MKSKVFLDYFDFKMLINAIRNAINNAIPINWVNFQKKAALNALKTLILWMQKFNAKWFENVRFKENHRFTLWKC